jgi:hypothetical protein
MPFSPIVLKAIVDVVSGGSAGDSAPSIGLYRSGPEIERFMLDCNLDFRIASGSESHRFLISSETLPLNLGASNMSCA